MIEPRKMRTSGQKDNFPTKLGRKADAITRAEGSSVGSASTTTGAGLRPNLKGLDEPPDPTVRASFQDTTVVVGAGHASKGVTRELVRSDCLPCGKKTGRKGVPVDQEPWRWQAVPVSQRASRGETRRRRNTTGIGKASEERSRRDGQPEVVADHNTEGWEKNAIREGGEPRPKGPTEGKVMPGITLCWGELRERR